jgi:hypothetical protein
MLAGSLRWPDFVWLHRRYTTLLCQSIHANNWFVFRAGCQGLVLGGRERIINLSAVWDLGGSDHQCPTVHLVVLFVSQNCFHSQMTKSTKHISLLVYGCNS